MLTVVHLTASDTSSRDEIVPVHGVDAAYVKVAAELMASARQIAVNRLIIAFLVFIPRAAGIGMRSGELNVYVSYIPQYQR